MPNPTTNQSTAAPRDCFCPTPAVRCANCALREEESYARSLPCGAADAYLDRWAGTLAALRQRAAQERKQQSYVGEPRTNAVPLGRRA